MRECRRKRKETEKRKKMKDEAWYTVKRRINTNYPRVSQQLSRPLRYEHYICLIVSEGAI